IAGPLHSGVIRQFKIGPRFQWLTLDLSTYKGRRAHLEFTPTEGGEFAIVKVLEADAPPGPPEQPNALVEKLLIGESSRSPGALAAACQRFFLDAVDLPAAARFLGDPNARDYAHLAKWLLASLPSPPERGRGAWGEGVASPLAKTAAPFLAEQAKLIAQIK